MKGVRAALAIMLMVAGFGGASKAFADPVYVQAADAEGRGFTFVDEFPHNLICYVIVPNHIRGRGSNPSNAPITVTQINGIELTAKFVAANPEMDIAIYSLGTERPTMKNFCRASFSVAGLDQAAQTLRASSGELVLEKVDNVAGFPATPMRVGSIQELPQLGVYVARFSKSDEAGLQQGVSGSLVWYRKIGGVKRTVVGSLDGRGEPPKDPTGLPIGMLVGVQGEQWKIVSTPALALAVRELLYPLDLEQVAVRSQEFSSAGRIRHRVPDEVRGKQRASRGRKMILDQTLNVASFHLTANGGGIVSGVTASLAGPGLSFGSNPGPEVTLFGSQGGGWAEIDMECKWNKFPKEKRLVVSCVLADGAAAYRELWFEVRDQLVPLREISLLGLG